MTVLFYEVSDGEQSFLTESWTQVASKTGAVHSSACFVMVSAEYGGLLTNRNVGIRVLVDGVEKAFDYHMPWVSGQYKKFTDFGVLSPGTPGDRTISIEVRALGSGQTVLVRRMKLMVLQE